ncbi:MAG: endonuclease/exonuclease/phosphatase family protein [Ginsengibacter sp.]
MKCLFILLFFSITVFLKKETIAEGLNGQKETPKEIIILQINIWQEGTMVPGGFDAIVNEIVRSNADFVTLSEVRNYKDVDFTNRLVNALKQKGLTYYSFLTYDSGVLSKYKIREHKAVYPLANDHGTIYKLVTMIGDQRIAVYTAHLDYTNYACYLPRGYDGLTWKKLPAPIIDTLKIKEMNTASYRDDEIKIFIEDTDDEIAKGSFVFLGGDFNEPSWMDWTEETKDLYDHHDVVYHWDVSMLLHNAGFIDSYRHVHPSAVTHPGFTYPASNKDANISLLTWAPKADERERIDFIYYYPNKKLQLQTSKILGPESSIVRGERKKEETLDSFITPLGVWPTDHKAVLSTFIFNP